MDETIVNTINAAELPPELRAALHELAGSVEAVQPPRAPATSRRVNFRLGKLVQTVQALFSPHAWHRAIYAGQAPRILFLCTGNYYRSRFAEMVFNAWAEQRHLDWRAFSRGLALERGAHNVGPISPYVERYLNEMGLGALETARWPRQAVEADFAAADKIVALDEGEHRPLVAERFPRWVDQVEYWSIHDLDQSAAERALGEIAARVRRLIQNLDRH